MQTIVQKFGGTSVADIERIRNVARRAAKTHDQGHGVVVILSAMSGVTDSLIKKANRISATPDKRELDVLLAAPASGLVFDATDFYDGTAAFALGLNAGVLLEVAPQIDLNLQIGLRYLTGLSTVDAFRDTGLEDINSGSRRWTLPFVMGASYRF